MPVKTKATLSDELEKLSNFVVVPLTTIPGVTPAILIKGEQAGTMEKPNVELILQKSIASAFGKGEKTVMDETYHWGREIPGADIEIKGNTYWLFCNIEKDISVTMFVGRNAKLKLYKLAIYTDGGHFDWHMDSTHSDKHHATVLLALNTSWDGGDLILRCNGVEMCVDLTPKVQEGHHAKLQAVVFYTDTEHKVEPVTKGVWIILQYDVEVKGWSKGSKKDENKKSRDREDEDEDSGDEEDEEDSDSMDVDDDGESVLYTMGMVYSCRKSHQGTTSVTGDPAIIEKIISILQGLLKSNAEVTFAMQYLYCKSSILPKFLKGCNALLYEALVGSFDVSLHPVVFCQATDWDSGYGQDSEFCAYCFNNPKDTVPETKGTDKGSDDEELDEESDGMEEDNHGVTVFYTPKVYAIKLISSEDYIEHTGNEAQIGEHKYFGSGMFVHRKSS